MQYKAIFDKAATVLPVKMVINPSLPCEPELIDLTGIRLKDIMIVYDFFDEYWLMYVMTNPRTGREMTILCDCSPKEISDVNRRPTSVMPDFDDPRIKAILD